MYSKAKPTSTSAMTLSSSLPPSFNFCEYMEEQAPLSAASLSSLPEVSPPTRVHMAQHDQQISPYATKYFASPSPQQASSKTATSSKYQQPANRSQNQFRAHQATDLATNYQRCDPSSIPDCSYFPFFIDPKLEQNIFDLPSDCDLQNYGVSLLDFLHKTFETPTTNENTNDVNASAETLLENKTSDGCFTEDYKGNFNGSLLRKHSSCPRATMNEENQTNQCDSKPDSYKSFPKPVTAVTMRQEPIVAQRACSRPVDKPMPQFARSLDVNSALNIQVAKANSANKSAKPNFDLVSAGQVLHKHLQQHLYNQSGANPNSTGTKIITAGPEIQIPLKLDTKNPCYVNYPNATSDQQESLDPVGHLIALNNIRGLALFQGKDRQLKKHGVVSGMNSPFYQDVPPRLNARLPPYESHEQQLMESDWSKHVLSNHISEDMKRPSTNPDSSKLLHQRILPSHCRSTEFASKDNISSRGIPHSENCQTAAGQNYRLAGCALDGRDENGYKTSCFCAEHCFPPDEVSGDGHFEDPAFGHTSPSLRQQLNGANKYHRAPYEIDRLMFRQQKLRMQQQQQQQQQQHLLQQQQQQFLLRQQQQKHFLPLGVEPVCDHPECRENLRKLQTYNKHLGRFLDSEDALGDDMDASKPINVRLMLQQRHQDELKQHLKHQIFQQQMQVMKAREQQQRIRNENLCMLNNSQRCTSANGRIVEDFADMNLDDAKDPPNHLNIQVKSKTNNYCHNNNGNVASEKNRCLEAVGYDEQPPTDISGTEYTSNVVGNEETFLITSPIPVRKNRGTVVPPATTTTLPPKTSDKPPIISESGRMRYYPARAFKFYMEQHVEKVMQYYEDRRKRKQQLEKEMSDMEMEHSDRAEFRNLLAIKESNHLRLRRTKMDQSAFKKLANLGGGAFGNVFLVRKKDSGFLYAMKCMRKKDVWNKKQIAHVKAERDILAEADNRWVVKLYFSFQDADYLYLVMEYIPGGDLMGLLMKKGIFEHELAQFYIAELVLAIESVHRLGFIHRDIKPDNILINRNGHIKLTDFGLCTGFHWTHDSDYYREDKSTSPNSRLRRFEQMRDRSTGVEDREEGLRRKIAKSLVGTPNYIAPEVLLQSGYTSCCDWWSVGVILYEMRFGQPPFRADTPLETQRKVINWQTTLRYPEMKPRVSRETIDLISRLCCAPENRLGSREGGAGDIKSHSFFAGIHFETLHSIDAPYIPRLQGSTDLSHFDAAKPLSQKPEQGARYRGGGCKYERCPSTCSSPPSSPHHNFQCNNNFYGDDPHSFNSKAKLPPSYRSKPPRRSDSADSLYHSNGMAVVSAGSHRHRSPGGGWGSRNGGNDYGAEGSGGEESFTKHDFFDFTFRRFFDNESEATS